MQIPTRPPRLACLTSPGVSIARVLVAVALALPPMMLAGCGDSGPTGAARVGPDTSTLAGTWKGAVNGSGGPASITNVLNADSTMSGEGTIAFYCKVVGTWTVAAGRYTATGRACDGTIVTSVAPVTKLQLTGTWTGSNGTSGTFAVIKQ